MKPTPDVGALIIRIFGAPYYNYSTIYPQNPILIIISSTIIIIINNNNYIIIIIIIAILIVVIIIIMIVIIIKALTLRPHKHQALDPNLRVRSFRSVPAPSLLENLNPPIA